MEVKELMTAPVSTARPETSLGEIARTMREQDIGFVPICEDEKLVGIVTDRDIVLRIVADGRDARTATAGEVMSADVFHCFEHDSIKEAARLMSERQVRRLVVLSSEEKIVGVVSLGDIAKRSGKRRIPAHTLEAVSENRNGARQTAPPSNA